MVLILGSRSPRRVGIFNYFSLPFRQVPSPFDESSVPFNGDPVEHVLTISKGKADSLFKQFPDSPILTVDTVVFFEGELFGKPKSAEDAFTLLKRLSGKEHSVFSGLTIRKGNQETQEFEEAKVLFNPLTDNQILKYHKKINWRDKAGGYAVQGAGGLLIRRIDGCYYNVMGMPLNALCTILQSIGVDLWDFLK